MKVVLSILSVLGLMFIISSAQAAPIVAKLSGQTITTTAGWNDFNSLKNLKNRYILFSNIRWKVRRVMCLPNGHGFYLRIKPVPVDLPVGAMNRKKASTTITIFMDRFNTPTKRYRVVARGRTAAQGRRVSINSNPFCGLVPR